MNNHTKIHCPQCNTVIDVNSILCEQLESEVRKKLNFEREEERKKYEQRCRELEREKQEFQPHKEHDNKLLEEKLNMMLREEKLKMEGSIKKKIEQEKDEELQLLQNELSEKSKKLIELNNTKAEIQKLKREKDELKSVIEAEAQCQLSETLAAECEKIKAAEQNRNELKMKELEKQLEDQKKLTEEMKRRQEQGSIQLRGEVQEIAIEEWLRINFPFDTIIEVKKGHRGADCKHIVNTRPKENCGTIYYESKRTKDFGKGWIEKFKNDIREQGATVGILVTDIFPPGMERMGLRDGIWICNYEEFKSLCFIIRQHITDLDTVITTQENKGEKMAMLYDYLTSNEFRMQVEAIIDGYSQMKLDLEAEKRSITGHWKKREKQLEKVLNNTNYMYNSLKAIAGNAIQTIEVLELAEVV